MDGKGFGVMTAGIAADRDTDACYHASVPLAFGGQ